MDHHVSLYKKIKTLEEVGKKNPTFSKFVISLFVNSLKKNRSYNFDLFTDLLKSLISKAEIIKNHKFNVFKYTDVEKLDDALNFLMKKHNAEKMIKSITSKKYQKLITKQSIKLFVELMENDISKSELQMVLGKKLAAYKNSTQFCDAIKKVINNFSSFSMVSTLKTIKEKSLNVSVISSDADNNRLILKINDYNASSALGSHHWCISYNENYFNQYVTNQKSYSMFNKLGDLYPSGRTQYFIFNFNIEDNHSMIGVTFDQGKVHAAHFKDDSVCQVEVLEDKYAEIFDFHKAYMEKSLDYLAIQRKVESLKQDPDYLDLLSHFFLDSYKKSDYVKEVLYNRIVHILGVLKKGEKYDTLHKLFNTAYKIFEVEFDSHELYEKINDSDLMRNAKMRLTSSYVSDVNLFFNHIEYLESKDLLKNNNIDLWISVVRGFYFSGIWDRTDKNLLLIKNYIQKYFDDEHNFLNEIIKDIDKKVTN